MMTMRNDSALPAPALDVDAVRAFALVAELKSFTRAAQAVGVTQSAISLQLKRLETRLKRRLIERTPRSVELTAEGAAFLERARALVAAHDRAVADLEPLERRLTLGISDHAAGPELPTLLARVSGFDPQLNLDIRIGLSSEILDAFERGKLDAAIVRREPHRRGGEMLLEDSFGWFAAPTFRARPDERLRLAMLAAPCGVRALAIRALDRAKRPWVEAFTGGGVHAVAAAAAAGLAVAPFARRIAPTGLVDVGDAFSLPVLGKSAVVLHSRVSDGRALGALRTLAAAFRGVARKA
jgi:DNA-binding transcriptional LysR family regulator